MYFYGECVENVISFDFFGLVVVLCSVSLIYVLFLSVYVFIMVVQRVTLVLVVLFLW